MEDMWSQDPFFKKRDEVHTRLRPASASYLEDLRRTYGPPLPKRSDESYQRAKAYRDRETMQMQALVDDFERVSQENVNYQRAITSSTAMINALSKRLARIPKAGTEQNGSSASSIAVDTRPPVQHEVLTTDVPSSSGQAIEHPDEGRPTTDDGVSEQPTGGDVRAE